ncbi:MAG: helix-hairpin-helix domain-containing protein [Candidatus Dojkabacteria bacterium]|nr:helix-hairpin-helix domain-containing protein [Candidatus Dojkabacteria bacterium]
MKGKILFSDGENVIFLVNDIGYEVIFYNNIPRSDWDKIIDLFVVTKISEYSQQLYGFGTYEERKIFLSLDISGVSSKIIAKILYILNIKKIEDLKRVNLDELTKVPGVGKTTAIKVMFRISEILKKDNFFEDINSNYPKSFEEAISYLVKLGFNKDVLIAKYDPNLFADLTTEEIIKILIRNKN